MIYAYQKLKFEFAVFHLATLNHRADHSLPYETKDFQKNKILSPIYF